MEWELFKLLRSETTTNWLWSLCDSRQTLQHTSQPKVSYPHRLLQLRKELWPSSAGHSASRGETRPDLNAEQDANLISISRKHSTNEYRELHPLYRSWLSFGVSTAWYAVPSVYLWRLAMCSIRDDVFGQATLQWSYSYVTREQITGGILPAREM